MTKSDDRKLPDVEKALLDPGSVFASPEEVLRHKGLSRERMIEILRRWEYDASENCVSVEEGMPDGESDMLRRILLAMDKLGNGVDLENIGPTKQHGIPANTARKD